MLSGFLTAAGLPMLAAAAFGLRCAWTDYADWRRTGDPEEFDLAIGGLIIAAVFSIIGTAALVAAMMLN